ncbi:unnamed protein product [Dibothriocephalus latus]|uniref:Condensin complex subunit 1 C-terminal domain-containing protein n=1 Tax=Dibothriocephalus latus TaxID=60516 RepID=A0A3P7LKW1_DIBLA|nr:unnamed protein product [Dibothriocephalus latus]
MWTHCSRKLADHSRPTIISIILVVTLTTLFTVDIVVKIILHYIRIQAIHGLARLQSPLDKDCPVVAALLWLVRHDNSPEVRRRALVALILTTVTLPYVLERCRDVSNAVRKAAFSVLAERSVLRPLSIAQRISIIQDGLTDTCSEVQKAAEDLLRAWFEVVDEDPILLLRRLDTEGVPKTSALCLKRLLLILDEETLTSMINKWAAVYLDERYVSSVFPKSHLLLISHMGLVCSDLF